MKLGRLLMLNKLSLTLKGRRRGTAALARFPHIMHIGPRARRRIVARAGPTLVKLLAVGPIDVKKLMLMKHAALPNGLGARPSALIFFVPCPSRPAKLGPCPVAHCLGRRTHRHTRSPPP